MNDRQHYQGCDECRYATVRDLQLMEARLMATLDEVLAKVRENNTVLGSLNALLDGIRQQINDILSGAQVPAAVQAKIDAVFLELGTQRLQLDEVLTENTPAAPPEA